MRLRTYGIAAACAASSILTSAGDAAAYCRQRSCADAPELGQLCERDSDRCITEGVELSHPSPCLSYAVAAGGAESVGLDDVRFQRLVADAFATWAAVKCDDGRSPGFLATSAGIVRATEPSFCAEHPEMNTNVFFFVANWQNEAQALGFTHSSYVPGSGQVLDTDVELNADYINLEPAANRERLLRAVVTHEVGHFLGLAHSNDPDSVMAAEYDPRVALLTSLTTDDADGICAIFPPSGTPARCPEPRLTDVGLSARACGESGELPPEATSSCSSARLGTTSNAQRSAPYWVIGLSSLLGVSRFARRRRERR